MIIPSTQPFELVVVTKGPATEAQASGEVAENQLVIDGTLHTIQPVLVASPLRLPWIWCAQIWFSVTGLTFLSGCLMARRSPSGA